MREEPQCRPRVLPGLLQVDDDGAETLPPAGPGAGLGDEGVGASEAGSVPKWVIAAAIGVPVAAALAYILFGPSSDSEPKSTKKKKKKEDIKETPKAEAATVVDTEVKAKEEVGSSCQRPFK